MTYTYPEAGLVVRARAPLRLGLAGGGTDVAPYCDIHGGLVLNATIDKYAHVTIETRSDGHLEFMAADTSTNWVGEAEPPLPIDGILDLHKGVYNRIVSEFGDRRPLAMTMTTYSDAPPGSGLGSSSTLVVAMVKAFVELLNLPLGEYEIAHMAYEVERVDLGLNGGKQDQYAATFGGFNFMEFFANDRVIVNPLRVKNWIISELEACLLLYYTGVSRVSAEIIDEQSRNVLAGDPVPIEAFHQLRNDARIMKENLLRGELMQFATHMEHSWQSKKRTATSVTNERIDALYEGTKKAGAIAGKVSGAGGGGFMIFFVNPVKRMEVVRHLRATQGEVIACQFTKIGTQGWRL